MNLHLLVKMIIAGTDLLQLSLEFITADVLLYCSDS